MLVVLGSSVSAQCICGKLRFAIDGDQNYTYRFGIGEKIGYAVSFISRADQIHRSVVDPKQSLTIHESYRIYDKKSDKSQNVTFDKRNHLSISIDPYEKIIVEIINDKKEKMIIRFKKQGVDNTYNILTDFAPGDFRVDLTKIKFAINRLGKKKKTMFKGSEITRQSSNLGENRWSKIENIEEFRD